MPNPVLYEQDGHVVTLTLNRPDELNAFSDPTMIKAFLDALDKVRKSNDVRAVIVTGAGRAFSSGGNIKHMRDRVDMFEGGPAQIRQAYIDGIQKVPLSFYHLDIPVIAAINGPAFGAALDLVCMSDIRIANPTATFGAPFVKIGITPGDGAAWFLPRIIGQAKAAEMIFTGEAINADEALRAGLVSKIVEPDDLISEANIIAQKIADNAPLAVRLSKKLLRDGQQNTLESHLDLCATYQGIAHHSDDHMEAINAFFEKRKGKFKGN